MRVAARLARASFEADRELASFMAGLSAEGAIASFVGRARPQSKQGRQLERLFLDHHPRLTQRSLDDIATASARFGISGAMIIHRCGEILPNEPIVFVAAAAVHRRAALQAVDYMMDRLKTDAMFWKREDWVDGSQWIEPTQADREDRARWSKTCPE